MGVNVWAQTSYMCTSISCFFHIFAELPTLPAAAVVGIAVSLVVVFLITVSIVIIVILIMCRREVKKQREGIKA